MAPDHHDKVLAVTSHLPHLIAYTIVGTATELGEDLQSEVVAYSVLAQAVELVTRSAQYRPGHAHVRVGFGRNWIGSSEGSSRAA